MEGSGTLKKTPEFSVTLFFKPKEALIGFWNHPEELKKLVEYSRIDSFVLYLAYDIIVVSLLF